MPNRAKAFTHADLHRALKAAKTAGCNPARVEIEPSSGKIVLFFDDTPTPESRVAKFREKQDARKAQRDLSGHQQAGGRFS